MTSSNIELSYYLYMSKTHAYLVHDCTLLGDYFSRDIGIYSANYTTQETFSPEACLVLEKIFPDKKTSCEHTRFSIRFKSLSCINNCFLYFKVKMLLGSEHGLSYL